MTNISSEMAAAHELTEQDLYQAELKWPLKTKFYSHSSRDDNYNQAERLGLTSAQADNFRSTGYEIEFDIEIDESGTAIATHVNGVALVTPVKI